MVNKYKTWKKCVFCRSDIFIFRYRTCDVLQFQDMKPAVMFYLSVISVNYKSGS